MINITPLPPSTPNQQHNKNTEISYIQKAKKVKATKYHSSYELFFYSCVSHFLIFMEQHLEWKAKEEFYCTEKLALNCTFDSKYFDF